MKEISSILVGIALLFLGLSFVAPYFNPPSSAYLAVQVITIVFTIVSGLTMIANTFRKQ